MCNLFILNFHKFFEFSKLNSGKTQNFCIIIRFFFVWTPLLDPRILLNNAWIEKRSPNGKKIQLLYKNFESFQSSILKNQNIYYYIVFFYFLPPVLCISWNLFFIQFIFDTSTYLKFRFLKEKWTSTIPVVLTRVLKMSCSVGW